MKFKSESDKKNRNPNNVSSFTLVHLLPMVVLFVTFFTSCTSPRQFTYFGNLSDSQIVHLPAIPVPQPIIMPDDLLEIKIAGANEATAALLNTYSLSSNADKINEGYLVDFNGEVEFPILGKVHAAGLTKEQFKENLKEKVSKYLKDPLIAVKFLNFRFTVLGEVKVPGTFIVPNEKVTVLEALGHSGDMTGYSVRTNVKVIRDSSGVREIGKLDFTDKSVFLSKYYYLHRNDVVYVEVEKSKRNFDDFSKISAIVATLASLVAITVTVLR